MHLPLETYPDGQDKTFLQLGGGALQSLLDCQIHDPIVDNLSTSMNL